MTSQTSPDFAASSKTDAGAFDDKAALPGGTGRGNRNLVPRLMGVMEAGIDWVLWLLFGLGAICLFLLIERTIYFMMYARGVASARERLCGYLSEGNMDAALRYFGSRREIVSRMLAEAITNSSCAPEALAEMVEARLMIERQRLERGLSFVGTIGSNAPFLGLLGTVLGIIKAFHDLSVAGQAGPAVVMAGISEALVATAAGLLVAIPAVVIFNVFKARTKSVIAGTESVFKLFLSKQLDICLRSAKAGKQESADAECEVGLARKMG
jgi:biopolymer transport protein ExbB